MGLTHLGWGREVEHNTGSDPILNRSLITLENLILLTLMSKDKRIRQQKSTIRQSSPTLVGGGENL